MKLLEAIVRDMAMDDGEDYEGNPGEDGYGRDFEESGEDFEDDENYVEGEEDYNGAENYDDSEDEDEEPQPRTRRQKSTLLKFDDKEDEQLHKAISARAFKLAASYALPVGGRALAQQFAQELISIGWEAAQRQLPNYDPNYISPKTGMPVARNTNLLAYAYGEMQHECDRKYREIGRDISMDKQIGGEGEEGGEDDAIDLHDVLPDARTPTAQQNLERQEKIADVRNALAQLPERQRIIMKLLTGMGGEAPLTQLEIAKRVGISKQNVWHEMKRAEKTLYKILGDKYASDYPTAK
jgi:RNA polymerase sigma factor (sigma-70 family)